MDRWMDEQPFVCRFCYCELKYRKYAFPTNPTEITTIFVLAQMSNEPRVPPTKVPIAKTNSSSGWVKGPSIKFCMTLSMWWDNSSPSDLREEMEVYCNIPIENQ